MSAKVDAGKGRGETKELKERSTVERNRTPSKLDENSTPYGTGRNEPPLQSTKRKSFQYAGCLIWALIALLPLLIKNAFYEDCLVLTFLWAGVAGAWNITSGYAGQLSIGHAAFFGIGAYTSTLLYMHYSLSPWVGMLAGGVLAVAFAILIGSVTLRLRGPFFALATIAFAEVMRISAISWRGLTKGSLGILIPFKPGFFDMMWRGKEPYVWLTLAYMSLVYLICRYMESRRFGYYLVALRENEDAAAALGVHTSAMKVRATALSAFLTAIGGTLYAQYFLFVEPVAVFGIDISVQMALIAIIGGLATAGGPILGAFLLIPLSAFLRGWFASYSGLHGLVYGFTLVVIVMYMTEGLFPKASSLLDRLTGPRANVSRAAAGGQGSESSVVEDGGHTSVT